MTKKYVYFYTTQSDLPITGSGIFETSSPLKNSSWNEMMEKISKEMNDLSFAITSLKLLHVIEEDNNDQV